MEKLEIDAETYLLFILTFFKSCRHKMSVKNLVDSVDEIFVMQNENYNALWQKIQDMKRSATGESFWQELEAIVNLLLMTLFIGSPDDPETKRLAGAIRFLLGLDDDKLHYNHDSKTVSDGLKKDHHAKDNRKGLTAHTCCNSATCVPIQVAFQREARLYQLVPGGCLRDCTGNTLGR